MTPQLASQPSLSLSLSNTSQYLKQREFLGLGYVFTAGTDIITTYFGLEKFGLRESIPWTQWIIDNYGWEGVLLRFIIGSIFFLYLMRYQPNSVFKITRIPLVIILVLYFAFTTLNNTVLILGA